jgi:phosphate transport system protein
MATERNNKETRLPKMSTNALVEKEITKIKEQLLLIGGQVEDALKKAVCAIEDLDVSVARQIIDADEAIDLAEVALEEECLKLLALYHPVASDLRYIVTVLKVNNDLERIADLAVNLAENAIFLSEQPHMGFSFRFNEMESITRRMLKDSLDALVDMNVSKALDVCQSDDAVDDLNRQMYVKVKQEIQKQPNSVSPLINHMNISKCFERIADLSTNIAEDVMYLVNGKIARH